MNEDVRDPVVAERYRDIAVETTPESLDQAVLREASQQAGSRYSRSVFWLRPLAWAASIGLCLAIVIELNNIPRPEPSMMPVPASVPAPARSASLEEEAADGESNLPAATEDAEAAVEQDADVDETGVLAEHMEQRARKSVDADGRVSLDDLAQLEKAKSEEAYETLQRDDFAAVEAPALDELETLSRMREGSNTSDIPVGGAAMDTTAGVAMPAALPEDVDMADLAGLASETKQASARSFAPGTAPALELAIDLACTAADRETPESWLTCIQGLETDGMTEIAASEREQLKEAFPEFELP